MGTVNTTMRSVELVFRTIGERTSEVALELAKRNIQPQKIHIQTNIRPFSKAFQNSLKLKFESEYVVFMDADCLILEDLRPFLETTDLPYIDCYVFDKFRGRLHAGVHITRIDVVKAMREVPPPKDNKEYDLRPESWTRMHALRIIDEDKTIMQFKILHDFYQSYKHIFTKYSLRELRSRSEFERQRFTLAKLRWKPDDLDCIVADYAIKYTASVNLDDPKFNVEKYLLSLPDIAEIELNKLNIEEKGPLTLGDINKFYDEQVLKKHEETKGRKVFGIGLSRTGTKSLTRALNVLGLVVSHFPTDRLTYEELTKGEARLSSLEHLDGITDITLAPYFAQLDKRFPDAKFILTIRDKEPWLKSLEKHWSDKPVYDNIPDQEDIINMKRFLRAAVYGTFVYSEERLTYVYDQYHKSVIEYFKDKPGKLLIMDITKGDSWEKLCPFLNTPTPQGAFPDVKMKQKLREMLSRAI